jgi:hypothetical protein
MFCGRYCTFHCGLKGNMSSFPLKPQNTVNVASGCILPHAPDVPNMKAATGYREWEDRRKGGI